MEISEDPEIVTDSTTELSQEDKSTTEEELTQDSNDDEDSTEKPEVHFADGHTSISYVPEEEEDTLSTVSFILEQFTGHFLAGLPRILSLEEPKPIEMKDEFTQTFFKAMTKISKRRLMEIINTPVDYSDPTLVFFCPSYELLSTFIENNEDSVN